MRDEEREVQSLIFDLAQSERRGSQGQKTQIVEIP